MSPSHFRSAVRRAARPPDAPAGSPVSDAELLTRFLDGRDEAAFAALVGRHAAGVRAVCRTLLRDPNDVDDATQATFLVLVRRAETVRDRTALGGWLHRVAWRAANRLRAGNADRAKRIGPADPDTAPAPIAPPDAGQARRVVNEEIARLPEAYRVAVLTCYVAGVPTADAAARLGWPKGTLLTRLAWARKRLRARLAGRGLTVAAGSFSALLADPAVRPAVALAEQVARAGVLILAREPVPGDLVSDRTASLTEGVVRAMAWNKTGIAAAVGLVAVALLGIGLGRVTVATADAADGPDKAKPGLTAKGGNKPAVNPGDEDRSVVAEPADKPDGPGNDLVVRRPHGSFTREIPPFGKATLTFTENRLRIAAAVNIDKVSFTGTADADYSMNRESMVYGIITGVDVNTPFAGEGGVELALLAGAAHDIPFAFRVRVEDDAITVKDVKVGPFGTPLFTELFGKGGDAKEMMLMTAAIGGKFKADPNPVHEKLALPAKPRKK